MPKPRRVAFMLELEWSYKRHAGIFAGAQQYAEEQGWESTIDEFVAERLPVRRTKSLPYDGVIARAPKQLARALTGSDQPIQQIAREVGFGSPRTLNDAFRSEMGCTPREYRKQRQAES